MGPRSSIPRAVHQAAALLKVTSLAQGVHGVARNRATAPAARPPPATRSTPGRGFAVRAAATPDRTPSAKGPPLRWTEVRPCGFNSDHALIPEHAKLAIRHA